MLRMEVYILQWHRRRLYGLDLVNYHIHDLTGRILEDKDNHPRPPLKGN